MLICIMEPGKESYHQVEQVQQDLETLYLGIFLVLNI